MNLNLARWQVAITTVLDLFVSLAIGLSLVVTGVPLPVLSTR